MPKYDKVDTDDQVPDLSRRRVTTTQQASTPPADEEASAWVPITTTIPASMRRELKIALAAHDAKLKDVVTQALRAWLDDHPAQVR